MTVVSTDWLTDKLQELHQALSYLNIKYEYRKNMQLHIVGVTPLQHYKGDKSYIDKEIELETLFEQMFPNEEIVFVSDDSLIQVENPILILESIMYDYSYGKDYEDRIWINIFSGDKELIRLPKLYRGDVYSNITFHRPENTLLKL